jgi:HAD superfamily PSPase-like hydrolase
MAIRLVIFDVDGTLLNGYSWQHVHRELGTWDQAQEHKQRFFASQITYGEWARRDAALWKNRPLTEVEEAINRIPYTRGAKQALKTLKEKGVKTYLLSAGLALAAERILKDTQAVDGYTANVLEVKDGILTGRVTVSVAYDGKGKHIAKILRRFSLGPKECATVGDDPSLIPLFKAVGLAIAVNPTDNAVAAHADLKVTSRDLRDILPHILLQRQEIRTPTSTK